VRWAVFREGNSFAASQGEILFASSAWTWTRKKNKGNKECEFSFHQWLVLVDKIKWSPTSYSDKFFSGFVGWLGL